MGKTPQYRIQIRDHSLNPVGELTDFIDGDLVLNFNDVGQFTLTARALNNPMAQYFAAGNGVIVSRDRGDGSGAQTLFSGPFWHLERHGKDDTYVLAGPSDDWWLMARRVWPSGGLPFSTVVLQTSPLRYYRLGESSGTAATDSSGNGQHATYVGSPTLGVAGAIPGDPDTAITLNGSSQRVSVPVTGLPTGNAPISLGCWFKFAANPASSAALIGYGANPSAAHQDMYLYIDSSGRLNVDCQTGGAVTSAAVSTGVWHHAVATWDGTTLRLYLDGASVGTPLTPGAQSIPGSPICNLGALATSGNLFAGQLDECAIYGVTLSASQIAALYTAGITTHGAYDNRSGTASTVMQAYVNANAASGALAARQVYGLTLAADPVIGSNVTGNARYDVLMPLLQQLALSGGDLGFRIIQTDVGVLTFSIYQPVTQSNAIFSRDLGNLLDYVYTLDGPHVNADLAGGLGAGTGRVFVEADDATSISTWGRVEGFVDTRDTSDTATINQRLSADLAQNKQQTNLAITPQDTSALMYGRDYNLGDVVNVTIDGATITDKIRQVHIVLNGTDNELVTPGIGNAGAGQVAALFDARARALRAIQDKLNRLQTTQ